VSSVRASDKGHARQHKDGWRCAHAWPLGRHSVLSTNAQSETASGGQPFGTPIFEEEPRVVLAAPVSQRGFPAL